MNDPLQDAGMGVPTPAEMRNAAEWSEVHGDITRKRDRIVNWFFTLLIGCIGLAAIFWPAGK